MRQKDIFDALIYVYLSPIYSIDSSVSVYRADFLFLFTKSDLQMEGKHSCTHWPLNLSPSHRRVPSEALLQMATTCTRGSSHYACILAFPLLNVLDCVYTQ